MIIINWQAGWRGFQHHHYPDDPDDADPDPDDADHNHYFQWIEAEAWQMGLYGPGGHYLPHYDAFDTLVPE